MDSGKNTWPGGDILAASIIVFIIELIIALYVHDRIIRPYIGDMLVVVLVYCFVRVFVPRGMKRLPLYVFLFAVCERCCSISVWQSCWGCRGTLRPGLSWVLFLTGRILPVTARMPAYTNI